jgi:poly-gamma-glutamate synthesis protein (capsule biosynthesis protein)
VERLSTQQLRRRVQRYERRRRRRRLIGGLAVLLVAAIVLGSFFAFGRHSGRGPTVAVGESRGDTVSADSRDATPTGESAPVTIATSGDILIHSPVWYNALDNGGGSTYDFAPMFEAIRPWTEGVDLPVCHLETPLTTGEPSGYPSFATPADLAKGLKAAGWRTCDTASNHTLDRGQEGVDQTISLLEESAIRQTGSASSAKSAVRPLLVEAGPLTVGLLAYTDFTNGGPPEGPWSLNLLPADEPASGKAKRVAADAKRAVEAGADLVLVIIQWGDENSTTPNDSQMALARAVTAIPEVAAVSGQGPHVVQPIRRMNGKFVVFSAGNLLSNQSALAGLPAETQSGLIALFRVRTAGDEPVVARVDYLPTWVRLDDHLVEPVKWGLRNDKANAEALSASWESTVSIAGRGSRIRPIPRRLDRQGFPAEPR